MQKVGRVYVVIGAAQKTVPLLRSELCSQAIYEVAVLLHALISSALSVLHFSLPWTWLWCLMSQYPTVLATRPNHVRDRRKLTKIVASEEV